MSLITVVLGEGGGARVCSAAVLKWMVMGFLQLGTKQEGMEVGMDHSIHLWERVDFYMNSE
jgi:hypothetical protein